MKKTRAVFIPVTRIDSKLAMSLSPSFASFRLNIHIHIVVKQAKQWTNLSESRVPCSSIAKIARENC